MDTQQVQSQEFIDRVQEIIGYTFNDKSLLLQALTHPSAAEDNPIKNSYERLEFLGDSLLGAFIAYLVYERYPQVNEGDLTRMKVSLVSGDMLAKRAEELGFEEIIIFGSSERGTGKRGLTSALENVFEALTAAIALDGGISIASEWITRLLGDKIKSDTPVIVGSPKSVLQETLQAERITPTYQLDDTSGPPHARVFTCSVLREGKIIGTGSGNTKKEAEAEAATQALKALKDAQNKKKHK